MRFLFFDRILEFELQKRAVATKSVSNMDEFLPDHYERRAVMPATLIVETLAQLGGWLHIASRNFGVRTVLGAIQGARFHGIIEPGDQLLIEVEMVYAHKDGADLKGHVHVGKALVTEVDRLMFISEPGDEKDFRRRRDLFRYLTGGAELLG